MAHAPELDFHSFVNRMKGERVGGGPESTGHDYSYILDRQTRAAFEKARPVELAVAASVRMSKQLIRSQLLGNSVKVSDRQFPRIHRITQQCADTLHIPAPTVYLVPSPVLNAATYGTNEDSFIMIHSALASSYTDEELLTVIGHECGHIHNSHVVYLTALHFLTRMAGAFVAWIVEPATMALRAWSRRAEITCDRAGMLCVKDENVATRALAKLIVGSNDLFKEFNMDAFLEQYEEAKDGAGKFLEAFATHPYLTKRVLAMRTFGQSELYKKAANLGEGGLSMQEVDERVLALLKGDA